MRNFSLSITTPCSEKWASFTPTLKGGFCSSCRKEVVDYTNLSDEEIISFFKNKPANTCGRFRADQLKPYAETPLVKINPGFTLLKAGLMSFLMLVSRETCAQDNTSAVKTVVHGSENDRKNVVADTEHTVRGVVTGEGDEMPIPGVNIVLKGTTQGTVTDADGRFEFPVKLKAGDVLMFNFIGFETQEYKVRESASEVIQILLALDITIMGEVALSGVYEEQPSGLHKLWSKVKNLF